MYLMTLEENGQVLPILIQHLPKIPEFTELHLRYLKDKTLKLSLFPYFKEECQ